MRFGLLLSLFLCYAQILVAQPNRKPNGPGPAMIKGIVLDQDLNTPLEYATITVFKTADDSLLTGGMTDENGAFSLRVRPGSYYLVFEFLGYNPCLLYTSPSPRDATLSRMPSSA